MKYLDYITTTLNAAITAGIPCERTQTLGVVQSVRTQKKDKTVTWPAVYIGNGDMAYAGYDDNYNLVAYHRSINMSVQRLTGGAYGDGQGYIKMLHRMSLTVFANKEVLEMSNDQLALMLQLSMPDQLTKEQRPEMFFNVFINITDVVLNEEQVFNEEFKNVDYFLGPEHILLKCNYTIESTLDKRCFNKTCQ